MKSANSNSSEITSKPDLLQYTTNYASLARSYSQICDIQLKYINSLSSNKSQESNSISIPPIDSLLDSYALKVARKKDTYEKISTLEGICEGNEVFLIKRWKRKCRFVVELIAEMYSSYQLVQNRINHDQLSQEDIERLKIYVNAVKHDPNVNFTSTEFDQWDIFVPVSTRFLNDLLNNYNTYKNELNQQIVVKERLFYVLKKAKDQRARLKVYVNNLRDEIRYVEKKLRETAELMKTKMSDNSTDDVSSMIDENTFYIKKEDEREYYEKKILELEKLIKDEERRRKYLHNKFQQLIGNIRVCCRIRYSESCCFKLSNDDKIIVSSDKLPTRVTKAWGSSSKCFIFDRVFDCNSSQTSVFGSLEALLTSCVDGYNVCVMTYGQSGSGKSYTMWGTDTDPGLLPSALRQLLAVTVGRNQWRYRLSISMLEIRCGTGGNEDIYDLLEELKEHPAVPVSIRLFVKPDGVTVLQGACERVFETEVAALETLREGETNRRLAHPPPGSHLLVFVRVSGRRLECSNVGDKPDNEGVAAAGTRSEALLTLCDLACPGTKSLTVLARVFDSLRKGHRAAYKESMLTYLLKPSLGGDAKCLLIVNVRSEPEHVADTLATLSFGQSAMQVVPDKKVP